MQAGRFFLCTMLVVVAMLLTAPARAADWQAKWIWQRANGPDCSWICFRKSFELDEAPESAVANIAADTKYWMWINNEMAVFEGQLNRAWNPRDTWYDEVEIAEHLQPGRNTVAVLVLYRGFGNKGHNDSGRGGFLFQADLGGRMLLSDSSWKMKAHEAYAGSKQDGYVVNVNFDARKAMPGWYRTDYDDSGWSAPTEKGIPPCAPWNRLIRRAIPQWKDYGLKDYENLDDLRLPRSGPVRLVAHVPYNAQLHPGLKVRADAGGRQIRIVPIDNKPKKPTATYMTRAGEQEYESPIWMNGMRIEYTIPEGVTVLGLKYRETGYNCEFAGSFECEDALLNEIWQRATRTLYVCMRDQYMDCPDRERAQWWGDAVLQIGETFYALSREADALTAKAMRELVNWRKTEQRKSAPPHGPILYSPPMVPSGELPAQMLNSVGWDGFWRYYRYTDDAETIAYVYPHVKNYLAVWQMQPNGLPEHREGNWDWYDWGGNQDEAVLQVAWYYWACKAAREMAKLTGNTQDIPWFTERMQSIERSFDREFWTEKGYRKSTRTPDERANALAVLSGLADAAKYPVIRNAIVARRNSSPYMEKYSEEALFVMGYPEDGLNRLRERYNGMINGPAWAELSHSTTLYENFPRGSGATNNHAWNAPNTIMSQYVAGVAPEEPGFETYHVLPQMAWLKRVKARVPSVRGAIDVEHRRSATGFATELTSPAGTTAIVGMPKAGLRIRRITANGNEVWRDGRFVDGVEGVTEGGEDARFVRFRVTPGTWRFVAEGSGAN